MQCVVIEKYRLYSGNIEVNRRPVLFPQAQIIRYSGSSPQEQRESDVQGAEHGEVRAASANLRYCSLVDGYCQGYGSYFIDNL